MSKITMDATAKAQQDQLKQNVVALIMSEVTITYMTGEVEFI